MIRPDAVQRRDDHCVKALGAHVDDARQLESRQGSHSLVSKRKQLWSCQCR